MREAGLHRTVLCSLNSKPSLHRTYIHFQISSTCNSTYPVMCKYVTSCLWEFRNDCSEFLALLSSWC